LETAMITIHKIIRFKQLIVSSKNASQMAT
jgi:hypothetical protein